MPSLLLRLVLPPGRRLRPLARQRRPYRLPARPLVPEPVQVLE
jgi:hypothetical protein